MLKRITASCALMNSPYGAANKLPALPTIAQDLWRNLPPPALRALSKATMEGSARAADSAAGSVHVRLPLIHATNAFSLFATAVFGFGPSPQFSWGTLNGFMEQPTSCIKTPSLLPKTNRLVISSERRETLVDDPETGVKGPEAEASSSASVSPLLPPSSLSLSVPLSASTSVSVSFSVSVSSSSPSSSSEIEASEAAAASSSPSAASSTGGGARAISARSSGRYLGGAPPQNP
mmetsp:Transcript_18633/g.46319  ORF Transcript_18633/g.46319 Transcript_18633/m.46319 type:complete len:234 (+) Transcript_18633:1019-1720(+)